MNGRKIAIRGALFIIAFVVAGFVLARAFDGFDFATVVDDIVAMSIVDVLLLLGMLVVLIVAEAYLAAAFAPGLTVWRGGLAWLGSNAVASVVPGPSDIPLRYRMFRSWGLPTADAATSTAGATVLNTALKLILPALAAVGLAAGDIDLGGVTTAVVTACAVFVVVVLVGCLCFGSERRTLVAGDFVDRVWRRVRRRTATNTHGRFARRLVSQRRRTLTLIARSWRHILIGSILVTVIRAAIFVVCLRVVGLPSGSASTLALCCIWALVRGLTVLPTLPGDAGVSEVAFVSLVTQVAGRGTVNTVAAGVLIYRVLTWLLMIPIGGIAIVMWRAALRRDPERSGAAEVDVGL